jgi:hypothetical protein
MNRDGDELASESVVNMERHQAVFAFMGIEEQELLGSVASDDDGLGRSTSREIPRPKGIADT